jgi:Spy/CpxP family protein refolding chaperone
VWRGAATDPITPAKDRIAEILGPTSRILCPWPMNLKSSLIGLAINRSFLIALAFNSHVFSLLGPKHRLFVKGEGMRALATLLTLLAAGALVVAAEKTTLKMENQPMGGPPPLFLLQQKDVQKDLKLTSDQLGKVKEAYDKQKQDAQALRELQGDARQERVRELMRADQKTMHEILQPDQQKRLRQIMLQEQGAPAFAHPRVTRELNISDDQEQKIEDLLDTAGRKMHSLYRNGQESSARQQAEDLDKQTTTSILDVLTPEQRMKWKQLVGEPFHGEIPPPNAAESPRGH